MKNYNNFINEINSLRNFIFAVDIKNTRTEALNNLYEIASNYFKDFETFYPYYEFMHSIHSESPIKAWCLVFNMYSNVGTDKMSTSISYIHTPNWGVGYEYMDNIITLEELFDVGFAGVETYIESKKYNL